MLKITFIKYCDRFLGKLITVITRKQHPSGFHHYLHNSFLFIRPGGIGDAVLLLPAISALKERYPDVKITLLAERRNCAIFSLCSVSCVLFYDKPKDLLAAILGNYDLVIDTEQWHRLSAVVARLTQAPMLIGYATNERKRHFTHPVPYSQDEYEASSFLRLLEPLGIEKPVKIPASFLNVPEDASTRAKELLVEYANLAFVVIFPGASIPERRWGEEKFRGLAERLHALRIPVVVVGGEEDVACGEKIVANGYGLNLVSKTSLTETAAVIEKSAVLLSGDSGILHIGVGLGKPTVSLFGPGIEKKWAPRGEKHIVINKHLPCSPCTKFGYTPKCPINAKCMSDITVDEVFDAVMQLLERTDGLPDRKN